MTFSTHRRRLVLASSSAVALAATGLTHAGYNLWTNEYTFTHKELETALKRKFPHVGRYLGVIEVSLTEPRLRLDAERNRVTLQANAVVNNPLSPGQTFSGVLALNSGVRYDATQRAVLLDRPEVERFDFPDVPAQYARQLNLVGSLVTRDLLHDYPLYTFKPEELQFKGRTFEPGTITVQSDGIAVQVTLR